MTIDKAKFQAVIEQVDFTEGNLSDLEVLTNAADAGNSFEPDFTAIYATFGDIRIWANAKILEADQEKVMSDFLAEMKVVFDKFSAKIEIGSDATGYGESYGYGETAVGIKLTAIFDGVTSTKEINKQVIVSGDLV